MVARVRRPGLRHDQRRHGDCVVGKLTDSRVDGHDGRRRGDVLWRVGVTRRAWVVLTVSEYLQAPGGYWQLTAAHADLGDPRRSVSPRTPPSDLGMGSPPKPVSQQRATVIGNNLGLHLDRIYPHVPGRRPRRLPLSSGRVTDLIAAIVVTYNSADYISALLDSLPAAFGHIPRTIVVVDNGSTDGTPDLVESRGDATVIRSFNGGFAHGINTGAKAVPAATGLLILNPDATLGADSVPIMLSVLQGSVGVVAPRMREADGSLSPSLRRFPTLPRVGGLSFTKLAFFAERIEDLQEYTRQHAVDWAVGAVMLISRHCYDELHGFDESYFLYSEETDFCLRARNRGWTTVYTPGAECMHVGGGSGESSTTHTMKAINRVRIYGRFHSRALAWCYFWLVVTVEIRRAVLGHRQSRQTIQALLRPSLRPSQLNANQHLLPE